MRVVANLLFNFAIFIKPGCAEEFNIGCIAPRRMPECDDGLQNGDEALVKPGGLEVIGSGDFDFRDCARHEQTYHMLNGLARPMFRLLLDPDPRRAG